MFPCGGRVDGRGRYCQKHDKWYTRKSKYQFEDEPIPFHDRFLQWIPTPDKRTGLFHLNRLDLGCANTRNGPIIVARSPINGNLYLSLQDEDIPKLLNDGFLFKQLQPTINQYTLHEKDLDQQVGMGWTSMEQMIHFDPASYIEYWKIWNQHKRDLAQLLKDVSKTKTYAQRVWKFGIKTRDDEMQECIRQKKEFMPHWFDEIYVDPPPMELLVDGFDPVAYCKSQHPNLPKTFRPPCNLIYPMEHEKDRHYERYQFRWVEQNKRTLFSGHYKTNLIEEGETAFLKSYHRRRDGFLSRYCQPRWLEATFGEEFAEYERQESARFEKVKKL